MGGSFGIDDYFIESDGDDADDEYDHITNSKDKTNQYQLSVPPEVSILYFMPTYIICIYKYTNRKILLYHISAGSRVETQ